jgi:hypothetical protein
MTLMVMLPSYWGFKKFIYMYDVKNMSYVVNKKISNS